MLQSAVAALIAASAPAVLAGNGTRAATGQRLGATKVGATKVATVAQCQGVERHQAPASWAIDGVQSGAESQLVCRPCSQAMDSLAMTNSQTTKQEMAINNT